MFQEEYEKYLQEHGSFSHLDPVHDLLMEAMQEVRVGIHQMKEELAMMKSEMDEKCKTRKKITLVVLVFLFLCIVWNVMK